MKQIKIKKLKKLFFIKMETIHLWLKAKKLGKEKIL